MIAHIRETKKPSPASPLIRARHMVAETLLSDEPAKRRRAPLRKIAFLGGLAVLAAVAALAFYFCR